METIKKGGVLEGWGLVHYQHYRRLVLAATVLEMRFGPELAGDRAKAVDRVLGSDSLGHGLAHGTGHPRPARRRDRDDAARQQPGSLDCLASHRPGATATR